MVLALGACAVVEPPPGGPVDLVPPRVVAVSPDSGRTGLRDLTTIVVTFSEKMERVEANRWLYFYPAQKIRNTKWHGAITAEVSLLAPLPADTVIVVEVGGNMADAHRVKNRRSWRFPVATSDSLPLGQVQGRLVMADSAVTNGVVELYAVPPESLSYFQQSPLRRATTDASGRFSFRWLPVPGGPWLIRAFVDANHDLRLADQEAVRLLPDTLSLANDAAEVEVGVTALYSRTTSGAVAVAPFATPVTASRLGVWSMVISDQDTGWVPVPRPTPSSVAWLDSLVSTEVMPVPPGKVRLVAFVDVDGDSTFSAVGDSFWGDWPSSIKPDAAVGEGRLFLEPWLVVEDVSVEPGLTTAVTLPLTGFEVTPWVASAATVRDTSGKRE